MRRRNLETSRIQTCMFSVYFVQFMNIHEVVYGSLFISVLFMNIHEVMYGSLFISVQFMNIIEVMYGSIFISVQFMNIHEVMYGSIFISVQFMNIHELMYVSLFISVQFMNIHEVLILFVAATAANEQRQDRICIVGINADDAGRRIKQYSQSGEYRWPVFVCSTFSHDTGGTWAAEIKAVVETNVNSR